jgi:hypothetical protein
MELEDVDEDGEGEDAEVNHWRSRGHPDHDQVPASSQTPERHHLGKGR